MTKFLRDILRQPDELLSTLDYLCGNGRASLDRAVAAIRQARHVYVTGMGSSWHAALNAKSLFHRAGFPVQAPDAAELLHFDAVPKDSAIVVLSRTGRSAEIVNLLPKAHEAGATVIGITNAADCPVADGAHITVVIPVEFDHAVSVNTYSTLSFAGGLLACAAVGALDRSLVALLSQAIQDTAQALPGWQQQIEQSRWPSPHAGYYFLARSTSFGTCQETRLLWEEAAKRPATAMGTGSFRHGPQEMVTKEMRLGMWIDGRHMRSQDLAVARDLRKLGAAVMLIGQDLPSQSADLVFQLPPILPEWQFLTDIIPAQVAAERLSRLSGVDCDSFRLCSYVVEDESGLLPEGADVPNQAE